MAFANYYLNNTYNQDSITGIYGAKVETIPTQSTSAVFSPGRTLLQNFIVRPHESWTINGITVKMRVDLAAANSLTAGIKAVVYELTDPELGIYTLLSQYTSNQVNLSSNTDTYTDASFTFATPLIINNLSSNALKDGQPESRFLIGIQILSLANSPSVEIAQFSGSYTTNYPSLNASLGVGAGVSGTSAGTLYSYLTAEVKTTLIDSTTPTLTANTSLGFSTAFTLPASDLTPTFEYNLFQSSTTGLPLIPTFSTSYTLDLTNTTSESVTLPTQVSGILWVVMVSSSGSQPTTPTGWTALSLANPGSATTYQNTFYKYKTSDGQETFTISGHSDTSALLAIAISNASGAPRVMTSTGYSQTPNAPTGYSFSNNSLALVMAALDDSQYTTTPTVPSGYSNLRYQGSLNATTGSRSGAMSATKSLTTAALENPGAFGASSNLGYWVAHTIIIDPIIPTTGWVSQTVSPFTLTPSGGTGGQRYWLYSRYGYTGIPYKQVRSASVVILGAPSGVSVAASYTAPTSVTVTGNLTNNGGSAITFWKLEVSINNGAYSTVGTYSAQSGTNNTAFPTYTNTALLENTTYKYRLSATNSTGVYSTAVESSSFTTGTNVTAPTAPQNFSATLSVLADGKTTVNLSWGYPSSNGGTGQSITKFTLKRTTAPTTTLVDTLQFTYSDANVPANTSYTYTVTATNSAGLTSTAATVNITTDGGRYKVYNGSSWDSSPAYHLVDAVNTSTVYRIYVYDGISWKLSNN